LVRLESLTYFDTEGKQKEVKNIEKRVSRKGAATQRKEKRTNTVTENNSRKFTFIRGSASSHQANRLTQSPSACR